MYLAEMNLVLLRKKVHGIDCLGNCSAWLHFSFSSTLGSYWARCWTPLRIPPAPIFRWNSLCRKSTPLRSSYQDLSDHLLLTCSFHFKLWWLCYNAPRHISVTSLRKCYRHVFGSVCSAHDVCSNTKKWPWFLKSHGTHDGHARVAHEIGAGAAEVWTGQVQTTNWSTVDPWCMKNIKSTWNMSELEGGHVCQTSLEPGLGTRHVRCWDLTWVICWRVGHVQYRDRICPGNISRTRWLSQITPAKGLSPCGKELTRHVWQCLLETDTRAG
jgi:hypothetical protein